MKKLFIIFLAVSSVCIFSCRSSKFKGTSKAEDPVEAMSITCTQGQLDSSITKSISNKAGTKAKISGKLCSTGKITTGSVNILFIVDTSNSMAKADNTTSNCNRRLAVEAVKSKIGSSSNVKAAIVTFGAEATAYSWTDLSSLYTYNVCKSYGGTNYEDAFDKARSLLSGKEGTNIIYFITDGAPSVLNSNKYSNSWEKARDAGVTSMNNLKASVSNLTVYAVYLVDPALNTYGEGAPNETQTYDYLVTQIVGSSDRVKKVSEASELASHLTSFTNEIPAGEFSTANVSATVTVNSKSSSVGIKSLSFESEGIYKYELEEFTLQGEKNKTVDNVFKVEGTSSNGDKSSSTITVSFSQTN